MKSIDFLHYIDIDCVSASESLPSVIIHQNFFITSHQNTEHAVCIKEGVLIQEKGTLAMSAGWLAIILSDDEEEFTTSA